MRVYHSEFLFLNTSRNSNNFRIQSSKGRQELQKTPIPFFHFQIGPVAPNRAIGGRKSPFALSAVINRESRQQVWRATNDWNSCKNKWGCWRNAQSLDLWTRSSWWRQDWWVSRMDKHPTASLRFAYDDAAMGNFAVGAGIGDSTAARERAVDLFKCRGKSTSCDHLSQWREIGQSTAEAAAWHRGAADWTKPVKSMFWWLFYEVR